MTAHPTLRIVFDLDGTLCETDGTDYANAKPIEHRITEVRHLKQAGHTIIVHTARGDGMGEDHEPLTRRQLDDWGVPYDELRMNKPWGDLYVDDRAIKDSAFFGGDPG